MPTKLSEKAVEGSTFIIRVEFFETTPSGKTPIVPNSGLTWSLVDIEGNIINSRDNIPLDPPADTIDIALSGEDLASSGNHSLRRYLIVKGTYNGVFGNDLSIIDEVAFQISNLRGEP